MPNVLQVSLAELVGPGGTARVRLALEMDVDRTGGLIALLKRLV
jgi:hypothetical protein